MKKITELTFNNTYRRLPEEFYHIVNPKPFENPFLVAFNPEMATEIELDLNEAKRADIADYLSGKKIIPGSEPIALYYTGHQFGIYNPDLGDGRAVLLGEVINEKGDKWDLHLKGAGRTRYSRQFDGRAVLRSAIREYLCSEAMSYLGIPTTRALCIVGSNEKVERETAETSAMMIRTAKTHIRFGSFESFYYKRQLENLNILTNYVINNYFPEFKDENDRLTLFLTEVAKRTGSLVAKWQTLGFTHGVMNTDNMSIIGDTIDYGPYGFMDKFSREFTPNHSDHFGRYSYINQPSIAYWNLNKLLQCMSPLTDNNTMGRSLDTFKDSYAKTYLELMIKKLGFSDYRDGDKKFIDETLNLLEKNEIDYTIFFRNLSDFKVSGPDNHIKPDGMEEWYKKYKKRLGCEPLKDSDRKINMDKANPKYILRNYVAEEVIRKAVDLGDYSGIEKVRKLFMKPFDEQPENQKYAQAPPKWADGIAVSCSS